MISISNNRVGNGGGYSAIDLFKIFAAILVVAIHTHPFHDNLLVDYVFTCLCRVAVPVFFVFSSFIFYKKETPKIKKYLVRLLKMYSFWFVVELPFIYERFFINSDHGFILNLCFFAKNLLLQNTFYASWYLTALGEGMLIVYWLASKKKEHLLLALSCVCAIFALFGSTYSPFFHRLDSWRYLTYVFFIFTPSNSFIIAVPYCYIGMKLAKNYSQLIQVKRKGCILIAMLCVWISEIFLSTTFKNFEMTTDAMVSLFALAPILVLCLTCVPLSMNETVQKLIRSSSILVYLIHGLVCHILTAYLDFPNGVSLFLFTLVLSIGLSFVMIIMSKYVNFLKASY